MTWKGNLRYLRYISMSLKERSNFRIDFFIRLATGFISSYARVAVWVVVLSANAGAIGSDLAQQTIQYMVLSGFLFVIIYSGPRNAIFQRIQDGSIARDLLYPVSLPVTLYWQNIGDAVFGVLVRGIPTLVILSILFNISWAISPIGLGLFIAFTLLGFTINFFISRIVEMAAFWVYEISGLEYIYNAVREFFAGGFIPLWFYPMWILPVVNFLPFRNIVYTPIAFLLGTYGLADAPRHLVISLTWCVFFGVLAMLVWRAGIKKTEINGG
ncbi:MAG: ABC-2 family transporter protein [Defluviitaleaceae bacterium]|nr:ABC-2 family transporter protein [Defluviitaleaceae bacterium]